MEYGQPRYRDGHVSERGFCVFGTPLQLDVGRQGRRSPPRRLHSLQCDHVRMGSKRDAVRAHSRSVEEVDVLQSSPADHKDANSKLHHLSESLESVDLDALSEEERESLLSSFLNEILKLVREHPREFPELTSSSVLAARFPALADHFRNHDIIEN